MTNPENPSIPSLKERFRHGVLDLAAAIPLSMSSLSFRPVAGGPLEAIVTLGFGELSSGAETVDLSGLPVGDAAAQWFEANHRELVLDIRPEHAKSDFYRPFMQFGLQSVVVLPVFGEAGLVGTVALGSLERHAWTRRHLKLMQLLAAQLAAEFPRPAPAAETAEAHETPEEHSLRVGTKDASPAPVSRTDDLSAEASAKADAHVEAEAGGRLREWDPAAERLFGIPRESAFGESLAFFYRDTGGRLVATRLVDDLTARGRFTGRVLAWDSDGREVSCEVEVVQVRTPGGARGFRGRFRRAETDPRAEIRFDVATRFAFTNSLKST